MMRGGESQSSLRDGNRRGDLRIAGATLLLAMLFAAVAAGADDVRKVLERDGNGLLYEQMMQVMRQQYAERRDDFEASLVSVEKAEQRRLRQRGQFLDMLGPFPERTPLNAKVAGTIERDGYRIERVSYESRPGHRVTANLYVPDGDGPFPGVLVSCGHSANGKAMAAYQAACIRMVREGLVVLIFDPISQGERHQVLDLSPHGTTEHTLLHIGAVLVGLNTGNYRTWDAIRSLDYLAERPEVDARRLGMTGNSGGGTMTTWVMAIDDRVAVAAPSCFITTQQAVFEQLGPSDGEQQFPRQGLYGIERADFLMMRVPKPTKILAAERDYFPIAGARQVYDETKRFFAVYGHADRVAMFSYDDGHGWSQPRRQAAELWMRRWLLDQENPQPSPQDFTLQALSDATLQVTQSGQVLREHGDEVTVPQWNLARAKSLAADRRRFWSQSDEATRTARIRELLGLGQMAGTVEFERRGANEREGYRVERLLIQRDGFPLPALLFVPDKVRDGGSAALVIDSRGKDQAAEEAEGPVLSRVMQGRIVLSVDLRGFGETRDAQINPKYRNDAFRIAMLAMHIGQPLLGQRVADVAAALQVLGRNDIAGDRPVELVAVDRAVPVALHAAFLDPRIRELELHGGIRSWVDDVVARPTQPNLMEHAVPGALCWYDLPDLRL
jgi:dienelactone hydrolase